MSQKLILTTLLSLCAATSVMADHSDMAFDLSFQNKNRRNDDAGNIGNNRIPNLKELSNVLKEMWGDGWEKQFKKYRKDHGKNWWPNLQGEIDHFKQTGKVFDPKAFEDRLKAKEYQSKKNFTRYIEQVIEELVILYEKKEHILHRISSEIVIYDQVGEERVMRNLEKQIASRNPKWPPQRVINEVHRSAHKSKEMKAHDKDVKYLKGNGKQFDIIIARKIHTQSKRIENRIFKHINQSTNNQEIIDETSKADSYAQALEERQETINKLKTNKAQQVKSEKVTSDNGANFFSDANGLQEFFALLKNMGANDYDISQFKANLEKRRNNRKRKSRDDKK